MKADLHLHTHYSDGTDSPESLLKRASQFCFDVIAVTDHDTVDGVLEAIEAGKKLGVRVVPGVEITAQFHQQELHLLAYFPFNSGQDMGWHHGELVNQLESYSRHRFQRAEKMVEKLNALGVSITMDDVNKKNADSQKSKNKIRGTLGRPHVAAALMDGKHVASIDEAFNRYLKRGCPAWVDKERVDAGDIIRLVHQAGGIVILAHPGLLRNGGFPTPLIDEGIDGVEVYHSRHSSSQSARFKQLAQRHGLLITGGSDCHGMLKGEPLMGRVEFRGDYLDRFLEKLT